jgi:hypothetical protein
MSTDNLIVRLIERGLTVPPARGAARLLEGFDTTGTNLDAAIVEASAIYGGGAFKASAPATPEPAPARRATRST